MLLIAAQNGHGSVVRLLLDAQGDPAEGLQVCRPTAEGAGRFHVPDCRFVRRG